MRLMVNVAGVDDKAMVENQMKVSEKLNVWLMEKHVRLAKDYITAKMYAELRREQTI